MLRVLELLGSFGIGGAERAAQLIMQAADRSRFEFLALGFAEDGPRRAFLEASGIRCEVADSDYSKLERLVREFQPHLLHLHRGGEATSYSRYVLRLARELKLAVVETNVFGRVDTTPENRFILRHGHMSLASMLKYARATGHSMRDLYACGHRAIYNAVPSTAWSCLRASEAERQRTRKAWGVAEGELVALRVNRPDIRKWSTLLETALPKIVRANPNLKLAFRALPPNLEKSLKRRFGSRVIALPVTADDGELAQTYASADLMAHSSHIGESFGCVLAEAMYWGLPIVVDSTPTMDNAQVELVDNGKTGFVVNSPFAFADAVGCLCRDPQLRERMGAAGRRKAREQFADTIVARQWERVFVEAAVTAGQRVKEELREYVRGLPQLPDSARHEGFEAEYMQRLANVRCADWKRGVVERARVRLSFRAKNLRDSVRLARELGSRKVMERMWHRLCSTGNPFRRT